MFKGWSGLNFDDFFTRSDTGLRGHDGKVAKIRFFTDLGKFTFSNRVMVYWNSLPRHVLDCLTINGFKNKVDKVLRVDWGLV